MPKFYWHKKWVENLESLLDYLPKYWVTHATVYALSTENMQREESELKDLFKLIEVFTKKQKLLSFQAILCLLLISVFDLFAVPLFVLFRMPLIALQKK